TLRGVGKAPGGLLEPPTNAARELHAAASDVDRLEEDRRRKLTADDLPPELAAKVERDAEALNTQLASAKTIRETLAELGIVGENGTNAMQAALDAAPEKRREAANGCCRAAKALQKGWSEYREHAATTPVANDSETVVQDAAAQARQVLDHRALLRHWTSWNNVRHEAEAAGLSEFVDALQSGAFHPDDAMARFRLAY